ncbi:uncharacterized protein LOC120273238 [Dioscorea cayenensis subsp. rotundata]|uniref:Uncharacterized protein LOC120273238 n=1 Tax=Dioscorea cayennensis subsp. rotundata TaxID=55577 RepID=A0AB40C7H9_DIOCR|nr:uncharacterized protein LOC120273238 [Dioscorea cayenensis subsp. rotundata]
MTEDPAENELELLHSEEDMQDDIENITIVDPTDEWTQFRVDMATNIMDSDSQVGRRVQSKHYWTTDEDKALIDALIELSTNPMWRAENGFRNGYLVQLERMIKEKLPQSMIKASPNIESRVKLLRKQTTAISDILQISGFVWNYERCTIECEKSAYDEYVKNHKEAAGLYGKCFSFFNDLAPVFTKDRAQGTARGDIGDDAEQYAQENISLDEDMGFSQLPTDEFSTPMQEPASQQSPVASEVGPGFRSMADVAAKKDANREEHEERRKFLRQILPLVEGLSIHEVMFILQVLPKHEDELKTFVELPGSMKLPFCHVLLARLGYIPPNL